MQYRTRKPEHIARGSYQWSEYPDMRRAQIYMHANLFARIHELAMADGISISAVVRSLVCDGLAARAKAERAAPACVGAK